MERSPAMGESSGGKAVVAAPEPQEPLAHELWLEAKNCSPENQRSAERKQRPAQGPHGKSLRQIDGLRRSGSANVQQGQELDRWGPHPGVWRSLRRLGRELNAGEQLRRPAQNPRQPAPIGSGPLQRRAQDEKRRSGHGESNQDARDDAARQ